MSTWHYVQDNQKQGPVVTPALQTLISQGKLASNVQVWKNGMTDWVAANTLPEFAQNTPPAIPGSQPPPVSDAADIEKNKVLGILAYLGILFLVPLLAAPQSRFAKYHANQGLILFLTWIIIGIGSTIFSFIPFLGWIVYALISKLLYLGGLVFVVLGIVNASKGECKPLPFIGHFTLIK